MQIDPQTHSKDIHATNPTSEKPPWYPDLPERLVSGCCFPILWAIMVGQSTSVIDQDLASGIFRKERNGAERDKLVPELILEMARAVYPEATHETTGVFLRGITEAVVVLQSIPLPEIKDFFQNHPHIRPMG